LTSQAPRARPARVSDIGCGVPPRDLLLCAARRFGAQKSPSAGSLTAHPHDAAPCVQPSTAAPANGAGRSAPRALKAAAGSKTQPNLELARLSLKNAPEHFPIPAQLRGDNRSFWVIGGAKLLPAGDFSSGKVGKGSTSKVAPKRSFHLFAKCSSKASLC
jgi:hypothetical protein